PTEATSGQRPELAVIARGRIGKRSVIVADAGWAPASDGPRASTASATAPTIAEARARFVTG
ncbi:MAG TPA: hypothetical protein PKU97_23710, partial [Kofleriaceae bacterium]|nr:hypothetical protein [Kofleriaceae bacterium]